jgi:hypothetical protein
MTTKVPMFYMCVPLTITQSVTKTPTTPNFLDFFSRFSLVTTPKTRDVEQRFSVAVKQKVNRTTLKTQK